MRSESINPLVERAINDTNPGFSKWDYHDDGEWQAIINSAKGKYFEYIVADKLNRGEVVGDVVLPDGHKAVLAESMNQPGWDLQIVDAHGHVNDFLQLKVTDSASYIHEALTRYPDIKILATSDVAEQLGGNHLVLDAAMSEDQIRHAVNAALEHSDGFLEGFWDHFHPVLPLLITAAMQGYQVAVGKRDIQHAIEVGSARAQRALVTTSVGALAKAIGLGWAAIPAALLAGFWITDAQNIDGLIAQLKKSNWRLLLQARSYHLQETTNELA
jgi:hypothetical protein